MKGLTHFISGVAVSTFFPEAVRMARDDKSWILVLGGLYGILPDTLDFKLGRFLEDEEYVVDPDPNDVDARKIGEVVQKALDACVRENREVKISFRTVRLGVDYWRRYSIEFVPDKDGYSREVKIEVGPIVSTGQIPFPGTEPEEPEKRSYAFKPPFPLFGAREKATSIDILNGPEFSFRPTKDGKIEVIFLPWHRQWSHSYTMGLALGMWSWIGSIVFGNMAFFPGLLTWLGIIGGFSAGFFLIKKFFRSFWGRLSATLFYFVGTFVSALLLGRTFGVSPFSSPYYLYLVIPTLGFWTHITEDMLGFMGGNLLWPITTDRTRGLKISKASDPIPNFFFIWTSLLVILWNLDRFAPKHFLDWRYLFAAWFPVFVVYVVSIAISLSRRWQESLTGGYADSEGEAEEVVE